jgi:hypothetical protein
MHALGRSIVNALRGAGEDGASAEGVVSKEELLEELGRVSWTAEKQARLLESMERLVDQLQQDRRMERRALERDQRSMLNEQDLFVAEMIEEHEAKLATITAERDEALRRVSELEQQVAGLKGESRRSGTKPGAGQSEVASLRRELTYAKQRIEKLSSKCNVARDSLQRVLRQRDEAQQTVTRLMGELKQVGAESSTPSKPAAGSSPPPAISPDLESEPDLDLDLAALLEPDSSPPPPPSTEADLPPVTSQPQTPTPTPATPSGHRSPLALALANTDPSQRRPMSGQFAFTSSPPPAPERGSTRPPAKPDDKRK